MGSVLCSVYVYGGATQMPINIIITDNTTRTHNRLSRRARGQGRAIPSGKRGEHGRSLRSHVLFCISYHTRKRGTRVVACWCMFVWSVAPRVASREALGSVRGAKNPTTCDSCPSTPQAQPGTGRQCRTQPAQLGPDPADKQSRGARLR